MGRRRVVGMALAGLVLGFGGVTSGAGLVQASDRGGVFDFFGQLFGAPQRPVVVYPAPEVRRVPHRYSSLPDARRVTETRIRHYTPRPVSLAGADGWSRRPQRRRSTRTALAGPVSAAGPLSVCVRTCDGYMFPLGARHSQHEVPTQQAACAAACPDAPTTLYTLPWGKTELDQSVSLTGQPYLAAAWANVYKTKRVESCNCRTPGSTAAPLSIEHDPTIRPGDVVATRTSAAVVTRLSKGEVEVEDYRSTRQLSRAGRRFVEQRVGALQRDAAQREFRRSMRTVSAANDRIRVADATAAGLRVGSAEGDGMGEPALKTPGFAPVRVLVPSPFVY
ncbi:DUF2865 domain-containing protein [Methylobacterium brachythecii]|nr:DUF2865 domain-containing protein [Methylobacterium brachythecii]